MPDLGPRFTRGEYWLLETVAELRLPLRRLVCPHLPEALNKAHHGLDRETLATTLHAFAERGWIGFQRADLDSVERIHAALVWSDDRSTWGEGPTYGLTAAGGAAWEAFARPDWSRYVDWSYGIEDDGLKRHEVACSDPDRLRRAVAPHLPDGLEEGPTFVVERPFAVTYWRSLPEGHRVTFADRRDPLTKVQHTWYWPK